MSVTQYKMRSLADKHAAIEAAPVKKETKKKKKEVKSKKK